MVQYLPHTHLHPSLEIASDPMDYSMSESTSQLHVFI